MKPALHRRTLLALLASAYAVTAAGTDGRFTNPLFKGGDPWVTRVDGVYYYSAAYCGVADICIKSSRTLSGLANAPWQGVWKHPEDNAPNAREIWAPELHRVDGRWYIYYAADDGDNNHHRLYVLTTSSAIGPATGPYVAANTGHPYGLLADTSGHWAIDPNQFDGTDGRHYLTWSCTPYADSRFPQQMCLAPLRDAVHFAGSTVVISTPTEDWEKRGAAIQEGPVGYVRGGHTFITYSASASYIANDYAVGLLSLTPGAAPTGAGAWTKSGPIFDHYGQTYGPGSVVFAPSPDDRQWWNMYHAIERLDCNPAYTCRDIRMQPMEFNAAGAPDLGVPVQPGTPLPLPSGDASTVR